MWNIVSPPTEAPKNIKKKPYVPAKLNGTQSDTHTQFYPKLDLFEDQPGLESEGLESGGLESEPTDEGVTKVESTYDTDNGLGAEGDEEEETEDKSGECTSDKMGDENVNTMEKRNVIEDYSKTMVQKKSNTYDESTQKRESIQPPESSQNSELISSQSTDDTFKMIDISSIFIRPVVWGVYETRSVTITLPSKTFKDLKEFGKTTKQREAFVNSGPSIS
jgi:hypothetical protein